MTSKSRLPAACSAEEIDEAAVWAARLHSPDRSAAMEKGFRRWLRAKPSHAAAFEVVSEAWELAGAFKARPLPAMSRWQRAGFRAGFMGAVGTVVACIAVIAVVAIWSFGASGVATEVGEQRVLTLDDGSRITLNTASRVVVDYDERQRSVRLKHGEAMFEVAKDPRRPFVVTAANRSIRAVGTSFLVREEKNRLAVTLIEGSVIVSPARAAVVESSPRATPAAPGEATDQMTLTPGERLTFVADRALPIDHPPVEVLTAWRRGQVEIDDLPLSEAAEELNRYSKLQIIVEDEAAREIRINGIFRAGDTDGFAAAVAQSFGLQIERRAGQILLRQPQ